MLFKDADDCLRRLLKIGVLVLRLGHADWHMHANDMPLSRLLMNEHRQDRDVEKSSDCRRSGRPACSVAEKLRRNRILDVVDALVHEKIHKIALPHAAIELSRLVRINDADGADFPRQLVPRVKLLTAELKDLDMNELRAQGDQLKERLGEGVILLASSSGGKVSLLAMATDGAMAKGAHAGNLIKEAAKLVGGGGGGKPAMAQAGGKNPAGIPEALRAAEDILAKQLS